MTDATFQLPPQWSTFAGRVDAVYYLIYWLSVALFVGIIGTAAYFAVRYRRRPGVEAVPTGHNPKLEFAWTVLPLFVLVLLFHRGTETYLDTAVAPADALEVRVRAFQWGWDFEYPGGAHASTLNVPVKTPVKLVMSSNDVVHSLFIPAFRVKKDLVPGMYTSAWFEATHEGKTELLCAEFCGGKGEGASATGHWSMTTQVNIMSKEAFRAFLASATGPKPGESTEDWGRRLSVEKACTACHSLTGSITVGPSWKGVFGSERELDTGAKAIADENYLRESILEPKAKLVKGFGPVMPTYKGVLTDREVDAVIAFIKSQK